MNSQTDTFAIHVRHFEETVWVENYWARTVSSSLGRGTFPSGARMSSGPYTIPPLQAFSVLAIKIC